jgi:hypothetical protein
MKRAHDTGSSLDLLLDTICNMFGMVIFIAVLAAVLAAARGERTIEAAVAEATPEHVVEAHRLHATIDALKTNDDAALLSKRDESADELNRLSAIKADLTAIIDRFRSHLQAADTTSEAELRRSRIRTLAKKVQDAKDRQTIPLRTPRRHAIARRIPVQAYLTNDRFYLVNDWSDWKRTPNPISDRCRFWSTWNTQAVDPSTSTFEDNGTCKFRTGSRQIERSMQLRPDGGLPMETPEDAAAIADLLENLDPSEQYISFRVTPNSFDKFHLARRLAVQRGLEHNVEPIVASPSLRYDDAIRRGTSIAQ